MEIIKIKNNEELAIKKMAEAIMKDKVIIYPTDTVYGIGGNALSEEVVDRCYRIKKRNKEKPLSVIVKNLEMIKEYCTISEREEKKIKKYFPGPYTLLFRRKKNSPVSKGKKLGIRIPDYDFIRKVMDKIKVPLISTSANISGKPAPYSIDKISRKVLEAADLIIDSGKTKYKKPSIVVDLENERIIRNLLK